MGDKQFNLNIHLNKLYKEIKYAIDSRTSVTWRIMDFMAKTTELVTEMAFRVHPVA